MIAATASLKLTLDPLGNFFLQETLKIIDIICPENDHCMVHYRSLAYGLIMDLIFKMATTAKLDETLHHTRNSFKFLLV